MRAWLDDRSIEDFVATDFRRAPVARPGAARSAIALLDWGTVARILAVIPAREALVVARGRLLDLPVPRSLHALRRWMACGVGAVLRRAEVCDPGLSALAGAFASDLGGEARVQIFLTPPGTHGFGWHYDVEDVFVAQTAGRKDYYFRANTMSPPAEPEPDFSRFREERSPLATAHLVPGDWLYIPSRWWHVARGVEDSLSLSIGVRTPARRAGPAARPLRSAAAERST